jgi:hypothetical protein
VPLCDVCGVTVLAPRQATTKTQALTLTASWWGQITEICYEISDRVDNLKFVCSGAAIASDAVALLAVIPEHAHFAGIRGKPNCRIGRREWSTQLQAKYGSGSSSRSDDCPKGELIWRHRLNADYERACIAREIRSCKDAVDLFSSTNSPQPYTPQPISYIYFSSKDESSSAC